MESSTRPFRRSGLAILIAATTVTTAVLSAVVSQPAGVTAQGSRATPGRPTPDDERSPCTGVVTSTLSTNTLRVCDVLTNTVRLQPGCPFCMGGVSIVFVQPERVVGLMTFWMPPIVEQMLQALELYQKEFERNYNHPFLVQAGVVHYDATRAKTIVRMTSQMNLIRAAVRQAQDGAQDGGPYPEAAQLAIKLLDSAPRTSEAREAGGEKPCLEVIVFFGSHENSTEEIIANSAVSATVAKAAGVMVFTIGDDLDAEALAKIASRPEFFFRALDAEVLSEIYRAIAVSIPCPPDSFWGRR